MFVGVKVIGDSLEIANPFTTLNFEIVLLSGSVVISRGVKDDGAEAARLADMSSLIVWLGMNSWPVTASGGGYCSVWPTHIVVIYQCLDLCAPGQLFGEAL